MADSQRALKVRLRGVGFNLWVSGSSTPVLTHLMDGVHIHSSSLRKSQGVVSSNVISFFPLPLKGAYQTANERE